MRVSLCVVVFKTVAGSLQRGQPTPMLPILAGLLFSHSLFASRFDRGGEPGRPLAIAPLALLLHAGLRVELDADAVLHVVGPLPNVLVTVREVHRSVSIFLSLLEVARVCAAILIRELSFSFEEVLREGAIVGSLRLGEVVHTLTFEDAVLEVSLVEAAVGPLVPTLSIFLALHVLAFKLDLALFPGFTTESVLLVVHPIAFVRRALGVNEGTSSISHAVGPLTLVDGAIPLNHAA